jgi:16S rRNA (uracil1498-N3)-methyltransferase
MTTRIFLPEGIAAGAQFDLPEAAFNHVIRVLRIEQGESIILFDGKGTECSAQLISVLKKSATVKLAQPEYITRTSSAQITLAQGIAAADKMDWIVQKATELGVASIVPLACERSVIKLTGDRQAKRIEHWQRVAISACEQCAMNVVPTVFESQSLSGYVRSRFKNEHTDVPVNTMKSAESTEHCWVLSPTAGKSMVQAAKEIETSSIKNITLLIGPEGGLSANELNDATVAGFQALTIGSRVLRTETAGLAAIAALQALLGDF